MTTDSRRAAPSRKELLKFLRLLAKRTRSGLAFEDRGSEVLLLTGNKGISISKTTVERAKADRLFHVRSDRYVLSFEGIQAVQEKLGLSPADTSIKSSRDEPVFKPKRERGDHNYSESPITRLFKRKTKSGRSYLSEAEFLAGERLRQDFEVGQLQPRITANYSYSAGSSGKGGKFHATEISDFAMDARERVNKAVRGLGPELSGVALDVCCFLKGLELVEVERSWPPRSAKLMLKTALSMLASHYGFAGYENQKAGSIVKWNSGGYRPDMH